jgi:uncharacterized OB-fold protein
MVLVATRDADQKTPQFPPSEFLRAGAVPADVELGPEGVLYSFTVVHAGKDKPPYGLAMVDFDAGVRVFGRLVEGASPATIGGVVRVVPHKLPDGASDYAFSPL